MIFPENGFWNNMDQSYFCPNGCGHKYKYRKGLQRHMQYECGVEKQFACIICGKAFSRRDHLKTHLIYVHEKSSGLKLRKKREDNLSFVDYYPKLM